MFDIGWGELVLIGIVALIAIGPKELPGVLRMAGQWIGKMRRMASEFQGQFHEAMREAEMADIKKSFDDVTNAARDLGGTVDPIETAGKNFETALTETSAAPTLPPAASIPDVVSPTIAAPAITAETIAPIATKPKSADAAKAKSKKPAKANAVKSTAKKSTASKRKSRSS